MRLRRTGIAIVVGALCCALPSCGRAAAADRPIELVVDARVHTGRVRPIWDEINLWKLQLLFGIQHPDPARSWGADWMKRRLPWVRYGRVITAVGGNYAPEIARWCDRAVASPEHPDAGVGECGQDGVPGWAAQNELIRTVDGTTVVDYTPFRTALERVLASGIRPHLNISAAPSVFTGGVVDFSHYHWNAAPVRDLDGWRAFVGGAFRAIADLDPRGWRVSIINEPNCLTLVGNVVSVAPWFDRMADMFTWHVYPKLRTYQLYGLLAGQLDATERCGEDSRGAERPTLANMSTSQSKQPAKKSSQPMLSEISRG